MLSYHAHLGLQGDTVAVWIELRLASRSLRIGVGRIQLPDNTLDLCSPCFAHNRRPQVDFVVLTRLIYEDNHAFAVVSAILVFAEMCQKLCRTPLSASLSVFLASPSTAFGLRRLACDIDLASVVVFIGITRFETLLYTTVSSRGLLVLVLFHASKQEEELMRAGSIATLVTDFPVFRLPLFHLIQTEIPRAWIEAVTA
ncbi:hypothetical protein KC338_g216 [Hortaea werneckii]|nr:hypothetical protein KC338_g216 [Hortaea werneckii]